MTEPGEGMEWDPIIRNRARIDRWSAIGPVVLAPALLAGLLLALFSGAAFQAFTAAWALGLLALVNRQHGGWRAPAMALLGLASLTTLAAFLRLVIDADPFPNGSAIRAVLDGAALWSLCLATAMYMGNGTSMRVSRQFVIGMAFALYLAVLALRAPIEYYGSLALGRADLPTIGEFMGNLVLFAAVGGLMTLALVRRLRRPRLPAPVPMGGAQ